MSENEILADLRRIRDEHARECGYDVHTMFQRMREETAQLAARGWQVVSPADEPTAVVREEPPKSY